MPHPTLLYNKYQQHLYSPSKHSSVNFDSPTLFMCNRVFRMCLPFLVFMVCEV